MWAYVVCSKTTETNKRLLDFGRCKGWIKTTTWKTEYTPYHTEKLTHSCCKWSSPRTIKVLYFSWMHSNSEYGSWHLCRNEVVRRAVRMYSCCCCGGGRCTWISLARSHQRSHQCHDQYGSGAHRRTRGRLRLSYYAVTLSCSTVIDCHCIQLASSRLLHGTIAIGHGYCGNNVPTVASRAPDSIWLSFSLVSSKQA